MKSLTKKELKTLRGWVDAHRMPVEDQEPEDCVCGLVDPCKHHADRQSTYASQLPPQTMARLLEEIENLRAQNKRLCAEIRGFRRRVVM